MLENVVQGPCLVMQNLAHFSSKDSISRQQLLSGINDIVSIRSG